MFLKHRLLITSGLDLSQVLVGELGGFAATGGAHKVAFLDEEWLIYFFYRASVVGNGGGYRVQSDGAAFELLDDGGEYPDVHLVKSVTVNV